MRYKVKAVIQAVGNPPVTMDYAYDTNELGVIESVAQLLKRNDDEVEYLIPMPKTLMIAIEVIE